MRKKEEDFDETQLLREEVEHFQNLIMLIRYRLLECSSHRLFVPTHQLDLVIRLIEMEIVEWHDGE